MNKIKLRRGFDIKLKGAVKSNQIFTPAVHRFSLKPTDFRGLSPIPKVVVEKGQDVLAGDVLFYDKKRPEIMYVAPVSGEVLDIVRGPKRAITDVVILADKEIKHKNFSPPSIDAKRGDIVDFLIQSGLWAYLNERPFDVVPNPDVVPKNIFISTFDTAPLALDHNLIVQGNEGAFQKGLDVLGTLTEGKVFLGLDGRPGKKSAPGYADAKGVVKTYFSGKHPAGNVGVHIHHLAPIKAGESVWTIPVEGVIIIGKMFLDGIYDTRKLVAITGAMTKEPKIISTYQGALVSDLLGDNVKDSAKSRVIAGNVLTGRKVEDGGYLSMNDNQITVIKEGDEYDFMGWLFPSKPTPSISGTFLSSLLGSREYEGETNTHGEKRAFVVTGQYERVLPMDIYPQHLMKAILTKDFEKMEGLGLAELTEEDIALCEYVCTSKQPLQKILREGLEMMKEQI